RRTRRGRGPELRIPDRAKGVRPWSPWRGNHLVGIVEVDDRARRPTVRGSLSGCRGLLVIGRDAVLAAATPSATAASATTASPARLVAVLGRSRLAGGSLELRRRV